jgi:phosphotransferase system enzyme I (PtsI)
MSEQRRLQGISASAGYAEGPLFDLDRIAVSYVGKETADDEKAALETAITVAAGRLTALIDAAEGDAADILEFQIAMLGDDALSSPAFAAIRSGLPADRAWRQALDGEIAGYDASDQD